MKAGRLTATAASIRVVRSPIAVNLLVHFFINSWLMVEGFAGHFLLISKPKSIKFFKRTKRKAQFEQPQVRTELGVFFVTMRGAWPSNIIAGSERRFPLPWTGSANVFQRLRR